MKGLLLKEFHIWLRTRSWITLYTLAMNILASTARNDILSVTGMGILIGSIASSFLYDEKSNWRTYCKALPCTPFERVTAKYIIHFSELFIGIVACVVSNTVARNNFYSSADIFVSPGSSQTYTETALLVASFVLFFAFLLPISFRFKGTLRTALSFIPVAAFLALYLSISISALQGNLTVFFEQKHIPILIIVASIVILAASWMLSVVFETASDTKYKKKFRKITIILVAIAVVIASAAAITIYNASENRTVDNSGKYDSMDNVETAAEEINKYYESFCDELRIGTKIYDYVLELEEAGFVQDDERTDIYYSESGNITVDIGVAYPSEDKIGNLSVTCKYATKTLESATYESFKNIGLSFKKGMTEVELHEKFRELEIIPCEIEEHTFYDTQMTRQYSFEFITLNFEDEVGGVEYSLRIDTDGEKITDVTDLMMHMRDRTPVATEPAETPLEVATREVTAFLNEFCNENHLDGTPRKAIKKLRDMGYSESEETFDLYCSEGGKIYVTLSTDENDALNKITAIVHYGQIRYLESATDLDMEKLADNFTVGMTESQFIKKIIELDMLPETVTEEYIDSGKHRRSYEIKYRIGDFNGNGNGICCITVDVTDGKVTDIMTF